MKISPPFKESPATLKKRRATSPGALAATLIAMSPGSAVEIEFGPYESMKDAQMEALNAASRYGFSACTAKTDRGTLKIYKLTAPQASP